MKLDEGLEGLISSGNLFGYIGANCSLLFLYSILDRSSSSFITIKRYRIFDKKISKPVDTIYNQRKNYIIVALTGIPGSGCSAFAETMAMPFAQWVENCLIRDFNCLEVFTIFQLSISVLGSVGAV